MKRLGNIYAEIYSLENLRAAEKKARKSKTKQSGVKVFDRNPEGNLLLIHESLLNKSYKTSPYKVFKITDPKERDVYCLPYSPDRIVHHAVMNKLEKMFTANFTTDTYSCIKKKGIHGASFSLRNALNDKLATTYCLKLDIKKFYPNVDHQVLKNLLRRKIKDKDLLWLLDEIIDSASGLPIGNYLSQYFANFFLSGFDHWIKEVKKVKYYFRYSDDLVVLAADKQYLHQLRFDISQYLETTLKLSVKDNYQVFPVEARGIDFVGYVHYHDCVYLRKSIKQALARAVKAGRHLSIASYFGWAKHCNSKNLLKKLSMTKFSELKITVPSAGFEGDKIEMYKVLNVEIRVLDFHIKPSKFTDKGNGHCLYIQAEVNGAKRVIFTGSGVLQETIKQVPKDAFPFTTTIRKDNERLQFT